MDTEEFLIIAEELAKKHPDDELSVKFLEMCRNTVTNERECMEIASRIVLKYQGVIIW